MSKIKTSFQIDSEILSRMLAKTRVAHPVNVLYPTPWASIQTNPSFGASQLFWSLDENGNFGFDACVMTETIGEACVIVRESDLAVAFIEKWRNRVLPRTPENIAWRKSGDLNLVNAPHLGAMEVGIPRGWKFNPKKGWELKPMSEGQEEIGQIVKNVQYFGYGYPNSGAISTWVDYFWGIATSEVYSGPVDQNEKPEIQKVYWFTPERVHDYMLEGGDQFSLAVLGKFREFARNSEKELLKTLGNLL